MTLYFTKPTSKRKPCCNHGPGHQPKPNPVECDDPECDCHKPPTCESTGEIQTATTANDPDDPSTWTPVGGKTTWIKKGNIIVGFVQPDGEVCLMQDDVSPDTEGCTAMVDCDGKAKIDLRQLTHPGGAPIDFRTYTIKAFPEVGTISNDGNGCIEFEGEITEPQKLSFCVLDTAGNESNVSCVIFIPFQADC